MTWATRKGFAVYPRTISWIAISVGGLAMFLIFGSWFLVSYPLGSIMRGYFYGVNSSKDLDFVISLGNQNATVLAHDSNLDLVPKKFPSDEVIVDKEVESESNPPPQSSSNTPANDENSNVIAKDLLPKSKSPDATNSSSQSVPETKEKRDEGAIPSVVSSKESKDDIDTSKSKNAEAGGSVSKGSISNSSDTDMGSKNPDPLPTNGSTASDLGCDLYHGTWVYDSAGPLYKNNSCPVLSQMQNCQGNGRPDKEYENWRWKPSQCNLPRFDPKKFLKLMSGKTLAFIGDSVARNQMESLLCILWQVEVPKNRGNKKMQRYYFRSTSVMIVRIWSSWLVKQTNEPLDFAQDGVVKLHLDAPDDHFMEFVPNFDVIVMSSGHWFAKQSVYVLNNEIVGGQLWWPDKSRRMKVNNIEAFQISVETILTALATSPNYTGLTIVRSYSPDHYEGGAWNTGGSCTGKDRPLAPGERVENKFTNIMHDKQLSGFNAAIKKLKNKSRLILMDITEAFEYRHDGHPGPYRNTDPNKLTKRGPDGKPPPQDCLHWCMPGPVDTWNELVLDIIRRDFEGNQHFSS
ncbi:Protein trichome birefringence-like 18 [Cucurbita argyrosperma subsp. argyrosperma]|nr:Protein trichome birefringence-like 18 [Cucurbita argyrosperma subsp. argyrosperma]